MSTKTGRSCLLPANFPLGDKISGIILAYPTENGGPEHAKTSYGKRGLEAKIGSLTAVVRYIYAPLLFGLLLLPILVLQQCVWRFSLVGTW